MTGFAGYLNTLFVFISLVFNFYVYVTPYEFKCKTVELC